MNKVNLGSRRILNKLTLPELKLLYRTIIDARIHLEYFRRKDVRYVTEYDNEHCHSIGICMAIRLAQHKYLADTISSSKGRRIGYKKLIESIQTTEQIAISLLQEYCNKKEYFPAYWWDKYNNSVRINILNEILEHIDMRMQKLSAKLIKQK